MKKMTFRKVLITSLLMYLVIKINSDSLLNLNGYINMYMPTAAKEVENRFILVDSKVKLRNHMKLFTRAKS